MCVCVCTCVHVVGGQAQNMVRFRELYGDMPGILVPGVLLDYSGKRVITSEWIDGEKVTVPYP